jgi:hypothetical protein
MRAQMLWRLESPERDADRCRQQNIALAQALDGDPSVVNPSRVLRCVDTGAERRFRLTRLLQRGADFERAAFEEAG